MDQKNPVNLSARTQELKPLTVTREVYKSFLTHKVFPAIRKMVSVTHRDNVVIRQDNARPHISVNDPDILEAGSQQSWSTVLQSQPASSSDSNILDLGFFNLFQSLQYQDCCHSKKLLVSAVENAFDDCPSEKLSKIFVSLQSVMYEAVKANGSSEFSVLITTNTKWMLETCLFFNLECDDSVIEGALTYSTLQEDSSAN